MIKIQFAVANHAPGIQSVCVRGYTATVTDLFSAEKISRVCELYYNQPRILKEITETSQEWQGYIVALENDEVVGAIGGGMTGSHISEVFVLYLDPTRRNEGIGTKLLEFLTIEQQNLGATEQWVSVLKDNQKGIPFYQARGFEYYSEKQAPNGEQNDPVLEDRYVRKI